MIKRGVVLLFTLLIAVSLVGAAAAQEAGNKRKGKYTYRKVYKACFERGGVESKTPPVSPADKTMAQWQQVFETQDFNQFGCTREWGQLNDEALQDIYAYLHAHGSDSPTPAKCK